jgi:hypothetical protein
MQNSSAGFRHYCPSDGFRHYLYISVWGPHMKQTEMIDVTHAVVWANPETREVRVLRDHAPEAWELQYPWTHPIGAWSLQWQKMSNRARIQLMMETAIDLAVEGFAMKDIMTAFAVVPQFKALGAESLPMYRALNSALVGQCLETNTMSFEELLLEYGCP